MQFFLFSFSRFFSTVFNLTADDSGVTPKQVHRFEFCTSKIQNRTPVSSILNDPKILGFRNLSSPLVVFLCWVFQRRKRKEEFLRIGHHRMFLLVAAVLPTFQSRGVFARTKCSSWACYELLLLCIYYVTVTKKDFLVLQQTGHILLNRLLPSLPLKEVHSFQYISL